MNGYINIPQQGNIDLCENAEATEIIVDEFLHYLDFEQIPKFFETLRNKLRRRGQLILIFNDFDLICKSYLNSGMTIADVNYILFNQRQNTITSTEIIDLLSSVKLKITSKSIAYHNFIIKATRL